MKNKSSLLLVLCFVITSCTMDCVEPGLQSRNTTVNVDVPVKKADDGATIHWVNSNQVINKDEKVKFTIGGSINLCHSQEGKNPRKVLVPASFCANGNMPNYDKAKDISKVPDNYGIDENELCRERGFGSNRRYVDTEIKVNPGDKLTFSLVPREMRIDHSNPKGVSFDDSYYKSEEGIEKVNVNEILKGGEFFTDKDGKRIKVKTSPLDKEKVLVGNGYTPYDNKVHFNKDHIGKDHTGSEVPWINGALLDLRRAKIGLDELCGKDRSDGWERRCGLDKMKKYSSYELNCYDQNICYNENGTWNSNGRNCVSSIRYKKYDDEKGACDMYSHLKEMEKDIKAGTFTEDDDSWAEALVAKIGAPYFGDIPESRRDDMKDTAEGSQCLPKNNGAKGDKICSKISNKSFEDFSLELNHAYKINEDVTPDSNVMLAIAYYGASGFKRGGYHVEVSRSCEFTNGQKLYMYLGDEPPAISLFETPNFKEVESLNKKTEGNVDYYIIDGSHLDEGESKKIYFGIDVSNVKEEDITDKDGKYYENNQYNVNLFVKKKINDFISSTMNKIFDLFLGEEEGKKGVEYIINKKDAGSMYSSYEEYRKGLLQGVRALLTLYVIFTVVGYMLGTVQLSKFDFIIRMTKIAFIAFVFSDKSWELFGTNLAKLFIGGSSYLVDSFSGYIGEGGKKFAFLDLTVGVLFTSETWLKFLSLMLAGPFGFIAFLLILKATFTFLTCFISAIVKYLIAIVFGAILLSLTPLFIVFILFQQTKPLFDNWIKTLAHVSLQPVILFSSLSLLNQLMYSVLYNLTNFSACYQCLISINFLSYDLCLMKSILPLGYSPGTSVDVALNGGRASGHFAALPIDLIQAFIYLMIASAMNAFVSASETIAQAIFKSGYGIAGSVSRVASSVSQSMLSTVGVDDDTQGMIQRIKGAEHKGPTKIEAKAKAPNTQPEAPSQSGNKGSGSNETMSTSKAKKDGGKRK
ncbi:type IV secretion system protein [Wolbachia endosymbiont (group E) of Neria commutata]|uniref:type IV secretion system protein n=1 Tax=Wolbachia endosymbiont (group E) of Neria commutata TaxID=3066149 RepID=UPI0031330D57